MAVPDTQVCAGGGARRQKAKKDRAMGLLRRKDRRSRLAKKRGFSPTTAHGQQQPSLSDGDSSEEVHPCRVKDERSGGGPVRDNGAAGGRALLRQQLPDDPGSLADRDNAQTAARQLLRLVSTWVVHSGNSFSVECVLPTVGTDTLLRTEHCQNANGDIVLREPTRTAPVERSFLSKLQHPRVPSRSCLSEHRQEPQAVGCHSQVEDGTRRDSAAASSYRSSIGPETASLTRCPFCTPAHPSVEPSHWPQNPLLFRAAPDKGMKVLGVRFDDAVDDTDGPTYLWTPSPANRNGSPQPIQSDLQLSCVGCEQCCTLPINDGHELSGKALVVDFESPLFCGTLMIRLRGAPSPIVVRQPSNHGISHTDRTYDLSKYRSTTSSWFDGRHCRYQVIVRGRFRSSDTTKQLSWHDLVTGYSLQRPPKKLPPKFLLWSGLKVLQFFAPQLDMQLESQKPIYCWLPLGSAPRSCWVYDKRGDSTVDRTKNVRHVQRTFDPRCTGASAAINNVGSGGSSALPLATQEREEPTTPDFSLLPHCSFGHIRDPVLRARARKRAFEKLHAMGSSKSSQMPRLRYDEDVYYDMEFFQHLFNYPDLELELGSTFGNFPAEDLLNGQPLQFLAQHAKTLECVFAFEIWNEKVWKDTPAQQRQQRRPSETGARKVRVWQS